MSTLSGGLAGFLRGLAGSADAPFSSADYNFLNKVWGYIRQAAAWTDINWADGYLSKQGAIGGRPPISDEAYSIMADTWGTIRVAANFGDINWAALGYAFTPQATAAVTPPAAPLLPYQPIAPPTPTLPNESFLDTLTNLLTGRESTPSTVVQYAPGPGGGSGDPYGGSSKPSMGPDPVLAAQNRLYLIGGGIALAAAGAWALSRKKRR